MEDTHTKILIVDDDLVLSGMVSEILTEDGYQVFVEHDGESGLARAEEVHPDLVMLDVMMPKMTGIAVLERIRETPWGKHTPAVLLTNVNEPESVSAATEKGGPVSYLLKTDWSIEQIVEKIKSLIVTPPTVR